MPDHTPLILLVGHCGPDAFMLRNVAQRAVPSARVEMVDDQPTLDTHLPRADLLLVNRVLDGSFPSAGGIELIRTLSPTAAAPAMMLVSNFADAQAQAEAAGALPGFGKRDAYAEGTTRLIRDAVDRAARARGVAS